MQITICDSGCGNTSLDSDAQIEKISVRMSQNGDEPIPEMSLMACSACRKAIRAHVTALFSPKKMTVRVKGEREVEQG